MAMKKFLVGGAVRDMLLGIEPKDRDYVITGATQDDVDRMIAQGFQQVGADFPVFLHPETGDEYAFARTERKVGVGYNGFETFTSPDLTIEDDLIRRDLTINAMAIDLETNELIDPFGGQEDLKEGVIRKTSDAFAEDPLRVMRAARFAARYKFTISPSTFEMMIDLVKSGEMDHLSRERVWVEFEKILSEKHSFIGVAQLFNCGALTRLFGENAGKVVKSLFGDKDKIFQFDKLDVQSKFIVLFGSIMQWTKQEMQDMRFPSSFMRALVLFNDVHMQIRNFVSLNMFEKYDVMMRINGFNDMAVFNSLKPAFNFLISNFESVDAQINDLVFKSSKVDCAQIASKFKNGKNIADAIKAARINAMFN